MTHGSRCVLWPIACCVLILGAPSPTVRAQLNPLDATERANVQLVLDNLRTLVNDWHGVVQAQPGRTERQRAAKAQAEEEIKEFQHVLDNLTDKLTSNKIKSVPDLSAGRPAKYRHGDAPSSPRAAYCDDETFVKSGDEWVRCDPGDIIIDRAEINPTPGAAIDPSGRRPDQKDAKWGWSLKWTLLHILVHEKYHEIMVQRQVKEEEGRHANEPDSQRRLHLQLARRNAATPQRHGEVYEGQKRVLRLYRRWLERQQAEARRARPVDRERVAALDERIKWLTDEVLELERRMKRAVGENEFAFDSCGYPASMENGTLGLYVRSFGGFWRMDVDVRNGKAVEFRLPLTQWAGVLYEEEAIPREPTTWAVLPQEVFSGMHIQVNPCEYLTEATSKGRVQTPADPAALDKLLPPAVRPDADESTTDQQAATAAVVGVVLPSDLRAGETITGSVVSDPARYRESPALTVIEIKTSLDVGEGGNPKLDRLQVNMGGDGWQPGGSPLTVRIPEGVTRLKIIVRRGDDTAALVERDLRVGRGEQSPPAPPAATAEQFDTPSLYAPDEVRVVRGPFDGDGQTTTLDLDGVPCTKLAETPRASYFRLADTTKPGAARLVMREGGIRAAFSVFVLGLTMGADQLNLIRGQSTRFNAVVTGPDLLPESAWRAAMPFDVTNLAVLREIAPGFRVPKPGDPGVILFTIRNTSPETISIDRARNEVVVLTLERGDFRAGPYRYDGTIRSKRSGGFSVQGTVIAFVSPAKGAPL